MNRAAARTACALALGAGIGGCGHAARQPPGRKVALRPSVAPLARAPKTPVRVHRNVPDPVALVTGETRNELMVIDLRSGRMRRRLALPADPENVVVGAAAVVVSPAARTVTVLAPQTLRVIAELHGFTSPHIPAITPDGEYAYVTDDGAGTVTTIQLSDAKVRSRVPVGLGAHHLTFSPDGRRLWIALGESARTIAILDVTDRAHPRVVRRFDPGFAVHDVLFSPDGREVWVSAAAGPDVTVLDASTLRVRFRVRVGRAPQHIAFNGAQAFLTSGYGATIEQVQAATGRILARAHSPYGSFELDAADGYVVTSSLLGGTLAIYDTRLRLRRIVPLAPATRDVAIVRSEP